MTNIRGYEYHQEGVTNIRIWGLLGQGSGDLDSGLTIWFLELLSHGNDMDHDQLKKGNLIWMRADTRCLRIVWFVGGS